VTHPFHPLHGRDFEFVACRQNWGEDRVHLHDENGQLFLLPARPGPRGASKLTEEILAWAEEQLAAAPALRPAQLPDRIADAFGVRVHPRSVERALARRRERHSKSRGTARPQDAEGG
jgi:transposase